MQTSNYRHDRAIVYRSAAKEMLHEAHAVGIKVVGWYLPSLNRLNQDFRRVRAAIDLRGPEGERFDSFALDIESTTVSDIKERNQRMLFLSNQIRDYVGTDYALGAIVPDPGHSMYWPGFPYKGVNDFFDVFLPMSYFTWRTAGYENVRKYVGLNIRKVRKGTGDKDVPIHVIGGLAGAASRREVQALVNTARERHIAGVSLYDFSITEDHEWEVMNKVAPAPRSAGRGLFREEPVGRQPRSQHESNGCPTCRFQALITFLLS
ncbi:MAG TPA: hypothetical protein VEV82_03180 [Actinomycetota bacterium]|nr:hypothetical protein [Actinomycetota bacterium]